MFKSAETCDDLNGEFNREGEYILGPDVVFILLHDGSARLLNFNGNFYGLSKTGAQLLAAILRASCPAAICQAASRYQIEESRVESDLTALIQSLRYEGLIRRRSSGSFGYQLGIKLASAILAPFLRVVRASSRTARSQAAALLTAAYFSTRVFGWSKTVAVWKICFGPPQVSRDSRALVVRLQDLDQIVRNAACRHFLCAECKERSLCCWALLIAQGIPAKLVVGVDVYPLASHCWVEVGATILTDFADKCIRYTPVLRYG